MGSLVVLAGGVAVGYELQGGSWDGHWMWVPMVLYIAWEEFWPGRRRRWRNLNGALRQRRAEEKERAARG